MALLVLTAGACWTPIPVVWIPFTGDLVEAPYGVNSPSGRLVWRDWRSGPGCRTGDGVLGIE